MVHRITPRKLDRPPESVGAGYHGGFGRREPRRVVIHQVANLTGSRPGPTGEVAPPDGARTGGLPVRGTHGGDLGPGEAGRLEQLAPFPSVYGWRSVGETAPSEPPGATNRQRQ